jgi:hypothetical protein
MSWRVGTRIRLFCARVEQNLVAGREKGRGGYLHFDIKENVFDRLEGCQIPSAGLLSGTYSCQRSVECSQSINDDNELTAHLVHDPPWLSSPHLLHLKLTSNFSRISMLIQLGLDPSPAPEL